jgi:hypothetical protein
MCEFIDFRKKKIFTEPDERSEYHFCQKSIDPHIYRIKRLIHLFYILNKKNIQ